MGTKMAAILSTTRCTGALEPWACCTMRIICASMVLLPTSRAVKRKAPLTTMVPASTRSSACLATAWGSPLIMLSSIVAVVSPQAVTTPSTATFSPALTSTQSPGCTAARGISTRASPLTTRAVLGARPMSERMAEAVLCLARSSSMRPVSTKVSIMTVAS